MKIRLLNNLKVDETTILPMGEVVELDAKLTKELLAIGAALPEAEAAAADDQGKTNQPALAVGDMTKEQLLVYGRDVLHVELDPNDDWAAMLAKVKQLQSVPEA